MGVTSRVSSITSNQHSAWMPFMAGGGGHKWAVLLSSGGPVVGRPPFGPLDVGWSRTTLISCPGNISSVTSRHLGSNKSCMPYHHPCCRTIEPACWTVEPAAACMTRWWIWQQLSQINLLVCGTIYVKAWLRYECMLVGASSDGNDEVMDGRCVPLGSSAI